MAGAPHSRRAAAAQRALCSPTSRTTSRTSGCNPCDVGVCVTSSTSLSGRLKKPPPTAAVLAAAVVAACFWSCGCWNHSVKRSKASRVTELTGAAAASVIGTGCRAGFNINLAWLPIELAPADGDGSGNCSRSSTFVKDCPGGGGANDPQQARQRRRRHKHRSITKAHSRLLFCCA